MNLNIIGNGFDLYHGLPSSYYYFGCYLIKHNPEFYEEIGKMYELHFMKMVGPPIAHDYEHVVDDFFWSDFESHLSRVDEFFVVESSEDDLGLEYPDPVEIELEQDKSADYIKSYFSKWIKDTLDVSENYSRIDNTIKTQNRMVFGEEDYFLQFNYTHTLQELYHIDDEMIHYVHGECRGEEGENLIVGHGNDERIQEVRRIIEKLDEEYDYTQKSYNRRNEYQCLHDYLKKLRKNVDECMYICRYFYEGIDDVESINVYGLSMGDVDISYLMQIRDRWPNAKWNFTYYNSGSIERIEKIAIDYLGLEVSMFRCSEFKNPQSWDIMESIISERDIELVDSIKRES